MTQELLNNSPTIPKFLAERGLAFGFNTYINPILPHISKNHLDIGCGFGELTAYFSLLHQESHITGYDIDSQKIARLHNRRNLTYVDSLKGSQRFSSASGIFVFHEAGKKLFQTGEHSLSSNSLFFIVDYNLKGVSKEAFFHFFSSESEKEETQKLGAEKTFHLHTQYNLSDCISLSGHNKFKTVSTEVVNNGKYFIWTGQKK